MAAALLTAAVAMATASLSPPSAAPFADAFWRKDLGLLVALLAEPGDPAEDEARAVFSDVVRLVNCEPLPAIPGSDLSPARELRQLVRLERARRARLGADAARSRTLWRDILQPSFFNRSLGAGPEGTLLVWPVETERWSAEALRARVRPSACAAAAPNPAAAAPRELDLATEALLINLARAAATDASLRPAASRLAYQRAVLLARSGDLAAAAGAARQLTDPEHLGPELARYARLLRLELGVDPPEGYAALMGVPFGPNQPAVDERLAYGLHRGGSWDKLQEVTAAASATPPAALCARDGNPLLRDLLYRHAVALERLGAPEPLDALLSRAFPACAGVAEPPVEALKDLALEHYARRPLDLALEGRLQALDGPQKLSRDVHRLGTRALHAGNLATAQRAMGWLITDRTASGRVRGWVLEAEIAFALQDGQRFDRAMASLFPDPAMDPLRPRERDERDRAVEALAQSLVTAAGDQATADFRRRLAQQLPVVRDRAAL
ncbi:MAG TPA: hypothetical protein VND93_11185, partial [Myxococcales bacterium]|nr:hypothetical protein [Myxococcales bacterium]